MSELIDRIPGQKSFLAEVRRLDTEAQSFKARQRTTGQGGQLGYVIQSDEDWDLTVALPTTPPNAAQYAEYRLTYTSDNSQPYPIVQPATDIRVNGTGESNKLTLNSSGRYIYSSGGNVVQMYYLDEPEPTYFESETKLSWFLAFEYLGTVTVRMKARGRGSSPGTWLIERIA